MKKSIRTLLGLLTVILLIGLCFSMAVVVSAAEPDVLWIGHKTFTEGETDDTTSENLPEPVIMSFTDKDKWYPRYGVFGNQTYYPPYGFFEQDDMVQGLYEFNSVDDGSGNTTCLKLNYHEYSPMVSYRVMPRFGRNSAKKLIMPLTADHKYIRITYMTPDNLPGTLTISNNSTSKTVTLVQNTAVSQGKWVRSDVRDISEGGSDGNMLERFMKGLHCTLGYKTTLSDAEFYIKEIGFFASEEQAYLYYGDEIAPSEMTFDSAGTGTAVNGDNVGVHSVNGVTGDLDITYASKTGINGYDNSNKDTAYSIKYMAKIKFKDANYINRNHRFMRVLYAAEHPDSFTKAASMYIFNDGNGNECVRLSDDVVDTNGEYVLTDTVYLPDGIIDRFSATGSSTSLKHCSLFTNTNVQGAKYSIKAVYFFPTREIADEFSYNDTASTVTLGENDIKNYKIVVVKDAPANIIDAAKMLVSRIRTLTGYNLPIVTDDSRESDYEILVGVSSRELSYAKNGEAKTPGSAFAFMDGDTFVVTSPAAPATKALMEFIIDSYLYGSLSEITIPSDLYVNYDYSKLTCYDWEKIENVDDPNRFYDPFAFDNGFWTEENAADNWYFEDGTYNSYGNGNTLSYIHTYERNVEYNMDIMYTDADSDGEMGLMLRYNSADAYVKAGYDFEKGEWYIASREGYDFYILKNASQTDEIKPGEWYSLTFTVDGSIATLYVNGEEVLYTDEIAHVTPGRVAVYANDVYMCVDNADIYMLSGEGTVVKDVAHTKLETGKYMEGGTVHELNDGTLVYHHHSGCGYYSYDNGVSWVKGEPCFPTDYGYMNVIRLLPTEGQEYGDFMQIIYSGDGMIYSATSSDDGKTWTRGQNPICHRMYQVNGMDSAAGGGNMNDKLFQSAKTGRIFYPQGYQTNAGPIDGRTVFCEFYYSDDYGDTWIKSKTDSWTIEGNENHAYFGECKILECDDGTLRVYSSWNDYGCIVYSESTDNGETWGKLQFMYDFPSSRSSMQFVRDPYADNDTTYYMVWVNTDSRSDSAGMPRPRLTLAKSIDGKNWDILGDVWRWESNYRIGGAFINHVVDPFIQVTEDYVLVGSGFSEAIGLDNDGGASNWHQSQRQHIYSIKKSSLGAELPALTFPYDTDSDGMTTLADLVILNRYLANWQGYDEENYCFGTIDINDDGAINPLDSVLLSRHLANWEKYENLSLIKYIPSKANDRYVITGGSVTEISGDSSEVGLPAVYGDNTVYYMYDSQAVELETGTTVSVYSTVKLAANRIYRIDENNVVYVEDDLTGTLDNTTHLSNNHWFSAKVNLQYYFSRDYAKYGITDVDNSNTVRYNDWQWYQKRLYGESATNSTVSKANAKISAYAKALTAVINTAIDKGLTADSANYSSIAANEDIKTSLNEFVRPYIEAKVKLAEDGSDIVFEPIPENIYDLDLISSKTYASFDSDGNLTLVMNGKTVIDSDDNVTDLVAVNHDDLTVWRYSEDPETTLKVLHSAPQVAIVGHPGDNDAYGRLFEKTLKDGVAVVMVGISNTNR